MIIFVIMQAVSTDNLLSEKKIVSERGIRGKNERERERERESVW